MLGLASEGEGGSGIPGFRLGGLRNPDPSKHSKTVRDYLQHLELK